MTVHIPMTNEQLSISIACQRRASHELNLVKTKQKTDWQLRQEISAMSEGFEKDEFRRWLNHFRHIINPTQPPESKSLNSNDGKKKRRKKQPRYDGRSRS
jgi:hypothetical protein